MPKYFLVEMPVDKDGKGPEMRVDLQERVLWQVWDETNATVAEFHCRSEAESFVGLLQSGPLLRQLKTYIANTNRDDSVCRGSFGLGTACGECRKCKAHAFEWLCSNSTALGEWAVLQTGKHDVMAAIKERYGGT